MTLLKKNADYKVVKSRTVPKKRNIIKDQIIRLNGFYSKQHCLYLHCIVEVWVEEKQDTITILTNKLDFGATTIAAIYKDRWQIELFFKAIKQNLRIKTFFGTSFNAVMIQIWIALIANLILKYLKAKSKINWSLSNLVALLRLNLLTYKDLWHWIDNPFDTLAPPPLGSQVCLSV